MEAVDISDGDPSQTWTRSFSRTVRLLETGTITEDYFITRTPTGIFAFALETGEERIVYETDRNYRSVLLADGRLFANWGGLISVAPSFLEGETGQRGYHPVSGHHDGWAEQASLSVDTLTIEIDQPELTPSEQTTIAVRAELETGLQATVTDEANLTVEDTSVVELGEDGSLIGTQPGETTVKVEYEGITETASVVVRETAGDGSPSPGPVVVAASIGAAAYLLSQYVENP